MMLTDTTLASDHATLKMLGERLAGHRLRRNLTQDRLAGMAGVSRVTLARMEAGHPMQVVNLLRVLRALDMLGSIEALVPDPGHQSGRHLQARARGRSTRWPSWRSACVGSRCRGGARPVKAMIRSLDSRVAADYLLPSSIGWTIPFAADCANSLATTDLQPEDRRRALRKPTEVW